MVLKLCVRMVAYYADYFADVVVGFKVSFPYFLLLSREESALDFSSMGKWGCWLRHASLFYTFAKGAYNLFEPAYGFCPLLLCEVVLLEGVSEVGDCKILLPKEGSV